jgi:hypothetical protein
MVLLVKANVIYPVLCPVVSSAAGAGGGHHPGAVHGAPGLNGPATLWPDDPVGECEF